MTQQGRQGQKAPENSFGTDTTVLEATIKGTGGW